ncbi:MAG: hypothetical protein B6D56_02330 [Candidatus Omnitrophica bacterium 4484_70.1]|nr:MAG: hypothetical protein B6D56_02330 [Candidatus Omnitrophica bacterium 4484_70.1]
MNIQQIIKKRRTIRLYKTKVISKSLINKIIEAGRWAPSAENSQPWKFIVLKSSKVRNEFIKSIIAKDYSKKFLTPVNLLLKASFKIIKEAPLIILVYNTHPLSKKIKKLGKVYEKLAYLSEIQSISAAIENMFLAATSLGIGMCWLNFPLLIKDEIEKFFKTKDELVAILTLGYPQEKGKRSKRKPISETVKYL